MLKRLHLILIQKKELEILFIQGLFKLDEAAQINLSLAVFNLLPVTMLDGGKILSSFVTERTIRIIGITIGIILSFLGAAVAIYTRRNFLILVVSLYVLIGAIK